MRSRGPFLFMRESFFGGLLKYGSLEVAAGAILMSSALARVYHVQMHLPVYVAQFSAVWFIYLLDRLFDARKIKYPAVNPRHLFYQQHRQRLLYVLVLAGLPGIVSVQFLPLPVLTWGFMLMGLCLLYLICVYLSDKKLPKEVLVAVLYTSGVSLAPRALAANAADIPDLIIFAALFLIAFINLVLFSHLEKEYDVLDGQSSFISRLASPKLNALVGVLFVLEFFLLAGMWTFRAIDGVPQLLVLLLAMTTVLLVLRKKMHSFANPLVFRMIADGIFLLPAFLLLLQ